MPQGGRHCVTVVFSATVLQRKRPRSLQTTLGVVGKRSGRVCQISGFCKQIDAAKLAEESPSTRRVDPRDGQDCPCTTSTSARRSKAADACACR